MSDRIVTGLRLLRAVMEAQRAHDVWTDRTGRHADAEWCRTRDALDAAQKALVEFEVSLEADATARDWKTRQSGADR